MSNQEILERAIQKAVDGGWIPDSPDWTPYYLSHYFNWQVYVYDHDFAKALWGEEPEYTLETRDHHGSLTVDSDTFTISNWKYHLQQMVISQDPIQYLGENL